MPFELPFDSWFYVAAIPAVFVAGVSKGGFGGGTGLASVPLIALTVPPATAAAVMLPILCVIDIVNIFAYWRRWDGANMRILISAALLGILLGALTFRYTSPDMLRALIGAIALVFTLRFLWNRFIVAGSRAAAGPSVVKGSLWGGLAGYTSFVAHAGGPPVAVYLLPQNLDKTVYQATTVIFFIVVNYVKLLPYALLGQFTGEVLTAAGLFFPLAILGALVGVRLHHRVDQRIFYGIVYALVFVTGIKLLYDGLTGMLGI